MDIFWFLVCYIIWALVFILPFLPYDFGYWFNMGQEPHTSRIRLWDFVSVGLGASKWEKFYLVLMLVILLMKSRNIKSFFFSKRDFLFYLFTLGILIEAMIFQVTSYTPPNNNIFFHSFAFVYLLSLTDFSRQFDHFPKLIIGSVLVMIWWSDTYWKYIERKLYRYFPTLTQVDENEISLNTYMIAEDENDIDMAQWVFSDIKVFQKVYMPESTVKGMERILDMEIVRTKGKNIKILNMTELTPLADEIGYNLEKNKTLWYHKGVGMFQKETDEYVQEIKEGKYDLVMFEIIPYLNNFYPFEVLEALREHYELVDRFLAPRRPTDSYIEVFIKPNDNSTDY